MICRRLPLEATNNKNNPEIDQNDESIKVLKITVSYFYNTERTEGTEAGVNNLPVPMLS